MFNRRDTFDQILTLIQTDERVQATIAGALLIWKFEDDDDDDGDGEEDRLESALEGRIQRGDE